MTKRLIISSSFAIIDFFQDTRGMEYIDFTIDDILKRIFHSMTMVGSIETAIDRDFHVLVDSIERPNNDGYLLANAYKRLAVNIYSELRTLDVWDSNGMLAVVYAGLLENDIILEFITPVDLTHNFRLTDPKPVKFAYDEWVAPLHWDSNNENNI